MGTNTRRKRAYRREIAALVVGFAVLGCLAWWYLDYVGSRGIISVQFDGGPSYNLEVAATAGERQKGLMFRKEMPRNRGMIFVFDTPKQQSFWMKNTFISLDMIFLDTGLKVVGIIPRVPINNEEKRGIDEISRYVVELNAGEAERAEIRVGSVMTVTSGEWPR